jgi:hypothetical protein
MTTDEVLDELERFCSSGDIEKHFHQQLEPQGEHPGDKVFRMPVPARDGRFMAVSFMFGQPDADEELNWALRWVAVQGPATLEELQRS